MICARITEKELREQSPVLVKLGYGSMQTALNYYFYDRKHFYTYSHNSGWKSDIYDFGRLVLSVGYQPIGKSVCYDVVEQYERDIQKIHDSEIPANEKHESVGRVFKEFLEYCIKNAK